MKLPFNGGCICGEVRYECGSHPLMMLNCHCRDCQQVGGGPYAPIVVVPLKAVKFSRGALQHYTTTRLSGRQNLRGFCAKCGSRLRHPARHHRPAGLQPGRPKLVQIRDGFFCWRCATVGHHECEFAKTSTISARQVTTD